MEKFVNISIHHIGGRSGTMEFEFLTQEFESCFTRVLYDADVNCIEQVQERLVGMNQTQILPYCISDKEGKEKFYLLADRYESSLIKPPLVAEESFVYNGGFGFDLDMRGKIDKEIELEVVSLDTIFYNNEKIQEALLVPDYLSLDVEGAELKILKGASKILKENVISLKCEFHSFDACTSIIEYTKAFGFIVSNTSLFEHNFTYKKQVPIGLHGAQKSNGVAGDITFLKSPKAILASSSLPMLDLLKAAFLAFIDYNIDKMYEYINTFLSLENSVKFLELNKQNAIYLAFLSDFSAQLGEYPDIKAMKFSTMFESQSTRGDRFSAQEHVINVEQLRSEYFKIVDKEEFKKYIGVFLNDSFIGVETVCETYGFIDHAQKYKEERLKASAILVVRLGLLQENKLDLSQI